MNIIKAISKKQTVANIFFEIYNHFIGNEEKFLEKFQKF